MRSPDAYAATDGRGTIAIAHDEALDSDDSLAQMILHELCHALVEGEAAWQKPDWGLDNQSERDAPREQACLRTQAALLRPLGLRWVLAPTTEYRSFYDALPLDPLADTDSTVEWARVALRRANTRPFAPHLAEALAATAVVARVAKQVTDRHSLWDLVEPPSVPHPVGLPLAAAANAGCSNCTWRYRVRGVERCRQADGARIDADWPACERWEPALDCQECGACCRAAYDSVTIGPREAIVRRHPELVVVRKDYVELARSGDRCAALDRVGTRYGCRVYNDRPRTCRDFERAGAHCLEARRRVGLSR